jgi:hypothetical protein
MKVTSPIGEFPFETKRVTIKNGKIVIEGSMGAWPATVDVERKDLLILARLIPWPVLAAAAVALAGMLTRRRGRMS